MGGEDGAEGRSSRARSSSSPAAPHLYCSRISSISISANSPAPQGRIESKAERQKPLRGHPLTAVPKRRSHPTHRASVSVCSPFLTASTQRDRFEPACQDKLTSLFMPLPPRALGTGVCQQRRGQVQVSPARLQPRTGHFYAPGMATFRDSGMSPALLSPL